MHRSVLSMFLILTWAGSVSAFEVSDLERCIVIESDSARLACFDAVTTREPDEKTEEAQQSPSASTADTGAWEISVEVDPMTDNQIVTLAVESDAQAASFQKPLLFVRCKASSLEVFIAWNEYLADEVVVTTRIDSGEPIISRWAGSMDQTATFAAQPKETVESLILAERYSARITPYRSAPITASFPVLGLGAIIASHEDACGQIKKNTTAPTP